MEMPDPLPPARTAATPTDPPADPGPLGRLAASARGWHRIQLAVLGFIGLCGVLWAGGDASGPSWLQWLAGALVLLALALACLAIYLVGRVAYPFHGPASEVGVAAAPPVDHGTRQLRTGIRVTYAAVAVLAVATVSGWWPSPTAGDVVEIRDAAGQAWCGELVDAPTGVVGLDTRDGPVTVPVARVVTLRPTSGC